MYSTLIILVLSINTIFKKIKKNYERKKSFNLKLYRLFYAPAVEAGINKTSSPSLTL